MTNYNKLEELKYRPLCPDDPELPLLESDFALPLSNHLPNDYKNFIKLYPHSGVFDLPVVFKPLECSPWADKGLEGLDIFYGRCSLLTNDLLAIRDDFIDSLDSRFVIIGEVTGNAFLCLDTNIDNNGQVYVWDRDSDPVIGEGMYVVSRSFGEFISILASEVASEGNEEPKLIEMKFSDDFKKRAAEILAKHKK